jgi:nucleoside-diphosphate-sugar epimerase
VVDSQLRVHDVDGVYVAGSSVFPTAGHCNPTQMIVATAIRLADELKQHVTASQTEAPACGVRRNPAAGRDIVLVTGASGRIGRHVCEQLIEQGFDVRAITSRSLRAPPPSVGRIEWRRHDFRESLAFDDLVAGCSAIVHLAAELGNPRHMIRSNVEATRALAEAAERAGIKSFVYTSSASVYGSLGDSPITENSRTITSQDDRKNEYWAASWLRVYGRTKLAGEQALHSVAKNVEYAIVRPTVVVDTQDLVALRHWGRARKYLFANRHAHHVFMPDVANAIVWLLRRALGRSTPQPGVATYVLAEDEADTRTYKHFFDKAWSATGDAAFRVPNIPWQIDWARAFLQARTMPLRPTFGRMRFSADKIRREGWSPPSGMDRAIEQALRQLSDD